MVPAEVYLQLRTYILYKFLGMSAYYLRHLFIKFLNHVLLCSFAQRKASSLMSFSAVFLGVIKALCLILIHSQLPGLIPYANLVDVNLVYVNASLQKQPWKCRTALESLYIDVDWMVPL